MGLAGVFHTFHQPAGVALHKIMQLIGRVIVDEKAFGAAVADVMGKNHGVKVETNVQTFSPLLSEMDVYLS